MKQKLLKRVSIFVSKIMQIIGTFILTIFFLIKYFFNLVREIIMMVFAHDDDPKVEVETEPEPVFKFSYVWKLLGNQTPKQVGKIIFVHAKETAQNTNKKFWVDLEKILPVIFTVLVLFLLFIGLAVTGLLNILSMWIVFALGLILYFVFLSWIRSLFKKILK